MSTSSETNHGLIRKATPADLDRLNEIATAAWTTIYEHRRTSVVGEEMFQDLWGGWRATQRVRPEHLNGSGSVQAIVTELDGKAIGFATWVVYNPNAGEVRGNAIDPAFQGRGLGTRQIRHVLRAMKDQGCRCAEVFTGLDPAHAPARGQYYAVGLRLPISTSVYLAPLRSVASAPRPARLQVVSGSPDHLFALTDIVEEVWGPIVSENERVTGGLYSLCHPNELSRRREMLSKHLAQSPNAVLVALDGGRPVGFCLLEFVAAKGAGGLAQLGVLPSARNRGAATALGMEAFRIFRERGLRYAQALTGPGENTEAARSFCHTLGLHREIPSVWLLGPI